VKDLWAFVVTVGMDAWGYCLRAIKSSGIKKKLCCVCCDEACSKLKRKAAGDGHTRSLKPYWGNPAVRNYRGDGGNLTFDREGVTEFLLPSVVKAPSFYSTASGESGVFLRNTGFKETYTERK